MTESFWRGRSTFVTGASGLMGGWLVKRLLEEGSDVTVLVRDHNPRSMTVWFAGGGVHGGARIGSTDELGLMAAENAYHLRDVHATILHLMGLNDMRLTYYHAGRYRRLTDTGGKVIKEILA